MINLQITIGDTDLHYLQKLSDYFMSVKTHHFSVKTFSDLSNLSNHLNTESTDILLITEKLYKQLHNIPPMTLLLRENGVGSNIKEHLSIPKYQSGSKIVEQMIHYYTLQSTSEVQFAPNRKKTALIGIYSPSGGSGKTTLSLMLAKALAAKGKNTLFISLEEIASYKHVLSATDETSLSDLLYYAHKRSDNLMMKLEGIQRLDKESGLKFIPAPIHSDDLLLSEDADWYYLLDYLLKFSDFETIVLDFTSVLSQRNVELFKKCQQLFVTTNLSFQQNAKLTAFVKTYGEVLGDKLTLLANLTKPMVEEVLVTVEGYDIKTTIPYRERLYQNSSNGIGQKMDDSCGEALMALIRGGA